MIRREPIGGGRDLVERVLGVAASGLWPEFFWWDPGPAGTGVVGLEARDVLEGEGFEILDQVEFAWRRDPSVTWLGWITYEAGVNALLGRREVDPNGLAGVTFRSFGGVLQLRPPSEGGQGLAVGTPHDVERWRTALRNTDPLRHSSWPLEALTPTQSAEAYRRKVSAAKAFILAGDTYQVNLSQAFRAAWTQGRPSVEAGAAMAYDQLRSASPASRGGLVSTPQGFVLSNSPETLVTIGRTRVGPYVSLSSSPIKGTAGRGALGLDPRGEARAWSRSWASGEAVPDAMAIGALQASEKDRAEHVMIVDLVRNDVGRLAVPGTVRVGRPRVMTLRHVHHLVSRVEALVSADWRLRDVVHALFPAGSITGAPKRRTLEIIAELEREARGIYCGSLVKLDHTGLTMTVAIRTGWIDEHGLALRAGGGVVFDSDEEAERQETLLKARAFDRPDPFRVAGLSS